MCNSTYKLKYYDLPGRAEPIRLIFILAKVPFEDVRIKLADWPNWKPTMPWGQIPVLEVDGNTIAQSTTIARFLARRFNLVGSNEFEQSKCEELVDSAVDFMLELKKLRHEKDESKQVIIQKALIETKIPSYYSKLDKLIKIENAGNNYFVGNFVTWADAWIYNLLDRIQEMFPQMDFLTNVPNLKNMKETFEAIPEVKTYLEKRKALLLKS